MKIPRRARWWLAGAALIIAWGLVRALAPDSQVAEVLFAFSILWVFASSLMLVLWIVFPSRP